MFLIHDNETGVGERREDGGTGAHNYPGLPLAYAMPLIEALTLGEVGVEDGNLILESCEA